MDLRVEVERAGCRRLWAFIDALPADAMFQRSREPQDEDGKPKTKVDEVNDFFKEFIN